MTRQDGIRQLLARLNELAEEETLSEDNATKTWLDCSGSWREYAKTRHGCASWPK